MRKKAPRYLEDFIYSKIPITEKMGIQPLEFNKNHLILKAPIAQNHNDKGTGFAGSVYSLAVLAGWAFIFLRLKEEEIPSDIMIYKADVTYHAPIAGDFKAKCEAPSNKEWANFMTQLTKVGKGKLELDVTIFDAGDIKLTLKGKYAAIKKQ